MGVVVGVLADKFFGLEAKLEIVVMGMRAPAKRAHMDVTLRTMMREEVVEPELVNHEVEPAEVMTVAGR